MDHETRSLAAMSHPYGQPSRPQFTGRQGSPDESPSWLATFLCAALVLMVAAGFAHLVALESLFHQGGAPCTITVGAVAALVAMLAFLTGVTRLPPLWLLRHGLAAVVVLIVVAVAIVVACVALMITWQTPVAIVPAGWLEVLACLGSLATFAWLWLLGRSAEQRGNAHLGGELRQYAGLSFILPVMMFVMVFFKIPGSTF